MTDPALKRILWRCRRGTRELDLVLTAFATERYPGLEESERLQFLQLLDLQDPVLAEWLCYDLDVHREYKHIVGLILEHKRRLSFQ